MEYPLSVSVQIHAGVQDVPVAKLSSSSSYTATPLGELLQILLRGKLFGHPRATFNVLYSAAVITQVQ